MANSLKLFAVFLVAVKLLHAAPTAATQASNEAWLRPPEEIQKFFHKPGKPSWIVRTIVGRIEEVNALLGAREFIEISNQKAEALGLTSSVANADSHLILTRAIRGASGGRFDLYQHDQDLMVHHSSLGHGQVVSAPVAVVLTLDLVPARVFSAYSAAE